MGGAVVTLRFGVLGPVQVLVDDRPVADLAPRHRAVLCCLLLHARRTVSSERLIDAIWGDTPPDRARGQIQVAVSALRRTLRDAGAGHLLQTRSAGYVLDVTPEQFDVDAFAALAASPDDADALRGALALWRGPALADVSAPYVEAARARLEDQRLAVVERLAELDLAAGRTALVVDELSGWTAEHPLRERLRRHLMLALYRLDRQPDALAVARDYRALLAEEHGLDPGKEFADLERAILTDDPALRPAPAAALRPAGPAQLPPDVPDFVGRVGETARLDELFDSAGAVVISTIEGTGGVGKTALALHWAHRVRDLYPDGQLYVNLHGYSATDPVRPLDAVTGFLRALGVPGEEIPVDLAEATAAYRTLLADRRVLVILDNAASPDQVRPLLPASRHSRVVVTSRDRLAGLVARDGARLLELGVLSPAEAVELLTRVLGRRRVLAEPDAVRELASLCGWLPLALRIAAAHLVSLPGRGIADLNTALRAGDRLAALEIDGDELSSVRAVFSHSYRALAPELARLFRHLGLLPGVDLTADSAAAVSGLPTARVTGLLELLSDASLLDRVGPGRYAQHDLIRVYARQLAEATEGQQGRRAALDGLARWCMATTDAAARVLYPQVMRLDVVPSEGPGFPDARDASAWLDAERINLVSTVEELAVHAPQPAVWLLASTLRGYFSAGFHVADGLTVARAGARIAVQVGDAQGQAMMEYSLGVGCLLARDRDRALDHLTLALDASRVAGWLTGEASVEGALGIIHVNGGRLDAGIEHMTRSAEIARSASLTALEASNLSNLAYLYAASGRLAESADTGARAMSLFRTLGSEVGVANALHSSGHAYVRLGRFPEARDMLTRAVATYRELGHHMVSGALVELATSCHELGLADEAAAHAEAALTAVRALGDGLQESDVQLLLGELAASPAEAMAAYEAALTLTRKVDVPENEAAALLGLSDCHAELGDPARAVELAEDGLDLAVRHSFQLHECEAHTRLAELRLGAGDRERAAGHVRRAVEIRERTGYRLHGDRTDAVAAAVAALSPRTG